MIRVLTAALAAAALAAQQTTPVFRAEVKLVRLLVTVKGEDGQLVGGLERGAFTVADSGAGQEIAVFERHTEQPLSVVLMIDTSASTAKDLKYETTAAIRFLKALTREGNPADALALYSFNHDVTQRSNFTRNSRRIEKQLEGLTSEAGTSLYDALTFGAEALEDRDGRRVIIMVTDGGDTTSVRSYHQALRAVHKADAIIYSIVVVPITNDAGRNTGGEHALVSMSRSTGGRSFFPSAGPALDQVFSDILRDLRTQYLIGYYPKNLPESKNKFRTVSVTASGAGLRVLTRGGYYED